jgi:polyferredoxin
MKKWRVYSDIIAFSVLTLLYLISSIEMGGGELSGRFLAMGGHLATADLAVIVIFLLSRIILIVFLTPYIGYRVCNYLLKSTKLFNDSSI